MAIKTVNTRFPHHCKVYRMVGETSFSDGEALVLYEGTCRKEGSTSKRTFSKNGVIHGDYRVGIGATQTGIQSGDFIDVTDRSGSYRHVVVSYVLVTNLGTSLFFNIPQN